MTIRIIQGDCLEMLATLPADSVHCVVTSPPYFGLRDYGIEGQIGLEPTLGEHISTMVEVFEAVKRVLRPDGTLWLNYGDCYASHDPGGYRAGEFLNPGGRAPKKQGQARNRAGVYRPDGLKPKDLCLIPERLGIALQDAGWWVRKRIVWAKPNPMPESAKDRPTSSHETIWLLTKSPQYFYDAEAVRESEVCGDHPRNMANQPKTYVPGATDHTGLRSGAKAARGQPPRHSQYETGHQTLDSTPRGAGRNMRDVWTIATFPYPNAHFATFPPELPERCIKAGTSAKGVCGDCGAPWVRETERIDQGYDGSRYGERAVAASGGALSGGTARSTLGSSNGKLTGKTETTGWYPSCACYGVPALPPMPRKPAIAKGTENDAETKQKLVDWEAESYRIAAERMRLVEAAAGLPTSFASVLDPFGGSGTVGLVADRLQRDAILIDLNTEYCEMGMKRIKDDGPLFAEVKY